MTKATPLLCTLCGPEEGLRGGKASVKRAISQTRGSRHSNICPFFNHSQVCRLLLIIRRGERTLCVHLESVVLQRLLTVLGPSKVLRTPEGRVL
jgi:hypothetical protein